MEPWVIERLNNLNLAFYQAVAHDFDQTRGSAWPGWQRLLPHLGRLPIPARVLDAGCGNGRFGVFLAQAGVACRYHGLDSSPELIARAQAALGAYPQLQAALMVGDLLTYDVPPGWDFIGLFGVLHHVPGLATRARLVARLAASLNPGGILAFAAWRFLESDRLRARVLPWDDDLAAWVEPHDYLLDWRQGERAVRYCHYVDDAEQQALEAATGLALLERYRADGADGQMNAYSLLVRPFSPAPP
jgi:SAM-dependent methyltransferase